MKSKLITIVHLICFCLLYTSCSERNEIPVVADSTCKLEGFLFANGIPVKDVIVSYQDTKLITNTVGGFSIQKDRGTSVLLFFEHPEFERDSLLQIFLEDAIIHFELTPVTESNTTDYYPPLLNHIWKYRYTHYYWLDGMEPPLVTDYIIEREIIDFDSTQIISDLHKYGMHILPSDTLYFDSTYQYTETLHEEGKVTSFHEVFRAALGTENLMLNRYMEEGLNDGKTDIEFIIPMIFTEYQSNAQFSGTSCLYANLISIWPYSPNEWNKIYLAKSIGLVKLHLEYGGNVDSYYWDIELIDFRKN